MDTQNQPLMGKKQLIKSVIIAFIIGAIVLVTAIFPAEYGMDPLGTGELFGFSKLYQGEGKANPIGEATGDNSALNFQKIKMEYLGSPPDRKAPEQTIDKSLINKLSKRTDSIQIKLPAEEGLEYKIKMLRYGKTKYEWTANKGIVYIDFHGELIEGGNGFFESYTQAYSNNLAGTFTAPFEGKHGWYFKNTTKEDIVITLRLNGEYELFKK
ncbi:hypothetical protein [Maribacter sp. 2304DJ31-5]|uniref:hypothetical protein n=1 Tax=Maribacter sp. 2304DJ31-5 TaxID=3386273 RepID=UPI0039BD62E3